MSRNRSTDQHQHVHHTYENKNKTEATSFKGFFKRSVIFVLEMLFLVFVVLPLLTWLAIHVVIPYAQNVITEVANSALPAQTATQTVEPAPAVPDPAAPAPDAAQPPAPTTP